MKTALQELIERLEEKIKIYSSNNLEREALGMIESKVIATELLEKERERLLDFAKWYDEELPEDDIVEMHVTNYLSSKSTKPKQR